MVESPFSNHRAMALSGDGMTLTLAEDLRPGPTVLMRLHGSMMVIGWLLFYSLGNVVARYFKRTWVDEEYRGEAAWFMYHRVYMMVTWVLSCCAFVLIFIERDGWSGSAHAIVGLVTFVLCFVQPIFGAIRLPGATKKTLRTVHMAVGYGVHVLAVTNMFLAVGLDSANLNRIMYGFLAAPLAIHLAAHVAYNVLEHLAATRKDPSLSFQQDAPFSRWRKTTLTVQMIGLYAFTVVNVVFIWQA